MQSTPPIYLRDNNFLALFLFELAKRMLKMCTPSFKNNKTATKSIEINRNNKDKNLQR